MRNTDILSGLFWLVVGIAIALGSLKYGFGTFYQPGPGFITFFAGAILSLLSIFLLSFSVKDREKIQSLWANLDVGKVLYLTLLLALYALFLKWLGFLMSTFILLFLLFRVKGTYRLRTVFLMSFLITISCYVIFDIWLKAQLPKGIFGRIF